MTKELMPVTQADRDAADRLWMETTGDWLGKWVRANSARILSALTRPREAGVVEERPQVYPDSELERIVNQNGPVVVDAMGEGLAWRPLDHGTWSALARPQRETSDGEIYSRASFDSEQERRDFIKSVRPREATGVVQPTARKAETMLALLRGWSDSEFAEAAGGEFGEDLKGRIISQAAELAVAKLHAEYLIKSGARQAAELSTLKRSVEEARELLRQTANALACSDKNDPMELIADNGMTVWDGMRLEHERLWPKVSAFLTSQGEGGK